MPLAKRQTAAQLTSQRPSVGKPSVVGSETVEQAITPCVAIGESVKYDPLTSYCDPDTGASTPMSEQRFTDITTVGSPIHKDPKASLVAPGAVKRAMSQCGTGPNTIEYDPFYAYCDSVSGEVHPIVPVPDGVLVPSPSQTAVTKRTLPRCGSGASIVEYDPDVDICDKRTGLLDPISGASTVLYPENTLVPLESVENFADFKSVPGREKREDRLSPGEWV